MLLQPIGFIKSADSKNGPFLIFFLAKKKIFSKTSILNAKLLMHKYPIDSNN